MPTFVMLTRLAHGSLTSPSSLEDLERKVMDRIRSEIPGVEWRLNLAVLGPYDYLDVFEAPDNDTALKVATVIRTTGHALTEVWPAKDWTEYKGMVRALRGGAG